LSEEKKIGFRVLAIGQEIANQARRTLKSPQYGHPAFVETATGYGPCRLCLETFETGREERLLFTYDPFEGLAELPLPGPVFIHREDCVRFDAAGFPPPLRDLPLLFEGYGDGGELIDRRKTDSASIERTITEIFTDDAVGYINIRNAEAGCFIATVESVRDSES
jgi:hypothetical protein